MVRKAKVLRSFLEDTPLKKTETGAHIIAETSDHPLVFVTPVPSIADLTNANNDLLAKTQAALSGDTELIKARDESEKTWITLFSKNCDYTDSIANGNLLIIAQAGHKPTKTDIQHKEIPGQVIVKLVKGDYTTKGKIDIECEALAGADFYLAVAAQVPLDLKSKGSQFGFTQQSTTEVAISTTRKLSMEGLESKAEYFVQVFAYNTAGVGPRSQTFSVVVP